MTTCYVCHREFAPWPGASAICPDCFAKRPAKLNRRVPRWRPQSEGPPLTRDEARALLAQADRKRAATRRRSTIRW